MLGCIVRREAADKLAARAQDVISVTVLPCAYAAPWITQPLSEAELMPGDAVVHAFELQPALNEESYRALVHSISTFVWFADGAGEINTPQPGWEAYTGHNFEQYGYARWLNDVHPDDRARVSEIWNKAVQARSWYEIHWRCWHGATQSWRHCITRGVPILRPDGSVREWIHAVTDIETHLANNDALEKKWLGVAHAEDKQNVMAACAEAAVSGHIDLTYRIVHPPSEIHWVGCSGAPLPNVQPAKITSSTSDVTDLVRANVQLAEANEQLSQFNFAVSHDMREPMRQIVAYSQLLERKLTGKLDDESREYLHFCLDGVVRLERMLEDLLIYSQPTSGAEGSEPVSSQEAFEAARSNLSKLIQESQAYIEAGHLPELLAKPSALTRLFQNLLSNAIKYRSSSPPCIRVSASRNGDFWTFSVADNGLGIAPADHETIFGMFKRLHTRLEFEGSGIGLALCKRIVERQGGRIWVESQLGQGSTFFFTLRAA